MILSVSESGSAPEKWVLSVGRTDTVSVSVYTRKLFILTVIHLYDYWTILVVVCSTTRRCIYLYSVQIIQFF